MISAIVIFTGKASLAAATAAPVWVVDPAASEDDLPATGRSLFDFLLDQQGMAGAGGVVPYPFARLLQAIESRVQAPSPGDNGLRQVAIPIGRSLQRMAAAPDFFKSPRMVVAVIGGPRVSQGDAGMLLKDRLYLGFQERSNILEVISYNEAAGRFEFQVVRDYRAGGRPRAAYANRGLCTACHQNAAPIFARPLWDETNANPQIAARLGAERQARVPAGGVDIAYAIDNATDRANLISAYQTLWREGCAASDAARARRCRAGLFTAMLQLRLSGRDFSRTARTYRDDVLPTMASTAVSRWPGGLLIPNPDIPNRSVDAAAGVHVAVAFDPLTTREPLDTWQAAPADALAARAATGLADFLAEAEIRELDTALFRKAQSRAAPRRSHTALCVIAEGDVPAGRRRMDFECNTQSQTPADGVIATGRLYLKGALIEGGSIDRLVIGSAAGHPVALSELALTPLRRNSRAAGTIDFDVSYQGRHARLTDGNAVESLALSFGKPVAGISPRRRNAAVVMTVLQDFTPIEAAVDSIAGADPRGVFSSLPFRRASAMRELYAALGLPTRRWCCDDGAPPPAAVQARQSEEEVARADRAGAPFATFYRYCASCHQSEDREPPNFLRGTAAQVTANIEHCAPRLYVRLAMWDVAPAQRSKTPMPPVHALGRMHIADSTWRTSPELSALRTHVGALVQREGGRLPAEQHMLHGGYEQLRGCLPRSSG